MFGLGTTELIVIAVILFFLFGAKKLPEIGKGLGGAIREFKKVKKDISAKGIFDDNPDPDKQSAREEAPKALESKAEDTVPQQIRGINEGLNKEKKEEKA